MKYIIVNDRTLRVKVYCAWCCEPITDNYLREWATHILYHNTYCYFQHCNISMLAIEHHARKVN